MLKDSLNAIDDELLAKLFEFLAHAVNDVDAINEAANMMNITNIRCEF
jgi:hypothetical protein